jgi:hypothetical protein
VHRLIARLGAKRRTYQSPPIDELVAEVDSWLTRLPWPWRTTCLKRSAILYALLRRSGEDVQLHIGVKREADRSFAAHAWLMRNDQPYLEPAGSTFATFQMITAFPEQPAATAPLPELVR